MPDHIHLVIEGLQDDSDCFTFVCELKQGSAFKFRRQAGKRLWQAGFHDHVLRNFESMQAVVRYVLENPVRAGLVTSPRHYPHLGSFVYPRHHLLEWAFGLDPDLA